MAMVVAQHSPQALTPLDDLECIARSCVRSQQLISATLMISLGVIMREVLGNRVSKRCLSEENHPAQTFGLD